MTLIETLKLAPLVVAAAMLVASGPGAAADGRSAAPTDFAAASRVHGGPQLAARCRRYCVQRQRRCHTERRCSYVTNRCRNVRVCNTVCAMYGYGPPGCTP